MSGDNDRRTIEPTPARIQQFRKRGEIARSGDLNAAATSVVGAVVALLLFGVTKTEVVELVKHTYGALDGGMDPHLATASAQAYFFAVLPALVGALAGCLVSTTIQLGAPPALSPLKFSPERPFSFPGIKQIFAPKEAAWRVLKSILKVGVVGTAAYFALAGDQMALTDPSRIISVLLRLVLNAGGALFLLGVADYAFSKRRIMEKMRMTPEELKREMKNQEGDPDIKRRRRQRMRELAKRRLAVEVPKADVVVLNPTHYAVAIRYRAEEGAAPRVVAKGVDAMAATIRELAKKHDVPMIRKPSLARLLYKSVKEGQAIPANTYRAVAEVLAYVYRVRKRKPS